MGKTAKLIIEGKTYEFPIVTGVEGDSAIDISNLRSETGLITLDPGYANTGSCKSSITFMDGEKGILRYRGIPIEQLAEHSTFVETGLYKLEASFEDTVTKLKKVEPSEKFAQEFYASAKAHIEQIKKVREEQIKRLSVEA